MTDTQTEIKNIVEAALLVAGVPLTLDKLLSLFPEDSRPSRDDVLAALKQIENECAGRGIELMQIEKGWRFQTRQKYSEWIARLSEERPVRYSRALLETLAIIAYRQPVTRGEIEDIRGVAVSSDIIKTLLGREWIRQVGTRDVPGRPALYGTTRGFLEHFNLASLDALPPLAELRDVEKIAAELNLRLPVDEPPAGNTDDASEAATESSAAPVSEPESENAVPLEAKSEDGEAPAKL
jgi:segregation and condensation protein B